jgi:DNA-binding SARP family transcriptional activator/predicted ATPase
MARLELEFLGTFQATADGEPLTRFETNPTRALLAYLALDAGTVFRREVLAGLLWPEQPRSDALHALRQTLNRLRRAVGGRDVDPPLLQVTRQTLQLNSDADYWLDVSHFNILVDGTLEHEHRRVEACNRCMERLAQASDLYRGNLLHGFHLDSQPFQEWLTMERERLHRRAMETFHQLATCHNQRGEYRQARHYARRQVELEPWREEAHRQLMLALAMSGQRSSALSQYENCRAILGDELGVEPDSETVVLYERIRDGDLQRSQAPPHNLPAPLTRFIGREDELDEIHEQLNRPDCRWMSLVGPGGVGKTRLALAAGAKAMAHFPDGTWFVHLGDVDAEPQDSLHDRISTAIAGALEITFSGQEDSGTELTASLRGKEILIILDGFEHLTSATSFLLEMLTQLPQLTVLVTSRARLNAQGEYFKQLGGLPVPAQEDDANGAKNDCVQLFIDRAECTPATPELDIDQIVDVCQLVDGVPLAIELASSWAEYLPLSEIIATLRDDIGSLSTTSPAVPKRHRQLRAVFESSWRLLSEVEQRALAQLAVFRGEFDRSAALAVSEVQTAELVSLMHKSLLQHIGPDRYALHALVRQFAVEKAEMLLKPQEVRDRHSRHYLSFAGECSTALHGDEPQQAMTELQAEHANVRQAWQWAVSRIELEKGPAQWIGLLIQCTEGLSRFFTLTGFVREGEVTFRTAAERVKELLEEQQVQDIPLDTLAAWHQALAMLLAVHGDFLVAMGDHSAAVAVLEEAHTAYVKVSEEYPEESLDVRAMLHVNLGTSYNRLGDYDLATEHLQAGLGLARQADAPGVKITALNTLAQAASEQGDYEIAQEYSSQVLELARNLGDRTHIASALSMLGSISWRWGDVEQAERCLQESLEIYKELGNRHRLPRLLNILGNFAVVQESFDRAEQHYEDGLALAREMGDRQAVADMLNNVGYINHHYKGDLEKARQYYRESLSIGREIGHRQGAASTLSNLGHLHVLLGEHRVAWDYLREALRESMEMGVIPLALDTLVGVARLRAQIERPLSAAELLGLALNHPAVMVDSAQAAEAILESLREGCPGDELEDALERGKGLELKAVIAELLTEKGDTDFP